MAPIVSADCIIILLAVNKRVGRSVSAVGEQISNSIAPQTDTYHFHVLINLGLEISNFYLDSNGILSKLTLGFQLSKNRLATRLLFYFLRMFSFSDDRQTNQHKNKSAEFIPSIMLQTFILTLTVAAQNRKCVPL